jgi:hypothetical protein
LSRRLKRPQIVRPVLSSRVTGDGVPDAGSRDFMGRQVLQGLIVFCVDFQMPSGFVTCINPWLSDNSTSSP